MPTDLGPRSSGQCHHYYLLYYYYYYSYVEMNRVLKTLRKMVNIKFFYKKVYNDLDIYTNTQIYIYIFIYMYISFLIIWLLKKVVITSVIIPKRTRLDWTGAETVAHPPSWCLRLATMTLWAFWCRSPQQQQRNQQMAPATVKKTKTPLHSTLPPTKQRRVKRPIKLRRDVGKPSLFSVQSSLSFLSQVSDEAVFSSKNPKNNHVILENLKRIADQQSPSATSTRTAPHTDKGSQKSDFQQNLCTIKMW